MMDRELIKDLYEESVEMEINNRGRCVMMLNKETSEVWNDFFVNQTDYKLYHNDAVVTVPVNDIIYKASDHILSKKEIVDSITRWVDTELDK